MKDFRVHFMLKMEKHTTIVTAKTPEQAVQYVRKNNPYAFITKVKVNRQVAQPVNPQ